MHPLSSRRVAQPTLQAGSSARSGSLRAPHAARVARQSHVVRVMEIEGVSQFETEVLQSTKPVLVDFWATWCGPCKLVAPLMDWAEKEYGERIKVVKINHTPNPEIIANLKVYGLPTLMVYKDGQLVPGSHREGAITKALLQKYIQQHILATVAA